MMKAMLQAQGGDQLDMEQMQRGCIQQIYRYVSETCCRHYATDGRWTGWTGRFRWARRYVRHVQDDGRYGSWQIVYSLSTSITNAKH